MAQPIAPTGLSGLVPEDSQQQQPAAQQGLPQTYDAETQLRRFYGGFSDRHMMWEQLKHEKHNNPVFEGLDEKQIGQVINDITGDEKGSRFDMFSSKTRWLDGLGYWVGEVAGSLGVNPVAGYEMMANGEYQDYTSLSDVGGMAGKELGKAFGVRSEDGLQQWEAAGQGLPAGLGIMGLAAIPYVGPYAMFGASYGKAVNDAKMAGASSGKAAAAGAIDTAVNMLTMKMGGVLADKASEKAINLFGKEVGKQAAGVGTAKALATLSGITTKEGEQIGGRALFDYAIEQGTLRGGRKAAAIATREALVEGAQSAIGVTGQIAKEGLLDYESLKESMADPNYWGTTLVSEGIFGLLGSSIGRMREANVIKQELGPNSTERSVHLANSVRPPGAFEDTGGIPTDGTAPVAPTDFMGLFVNSASRQDDVRQVAEAKGDQVKSAQAHAAQIKAASGGEQAIKATAKDGQDAVALVGAAVQGSDATGLNANAAQTAVEVLSKRSDIVENVLAESNKPPVDSPVRGMNVVGDVAYGVMSVEMGEGKPAVRLTAEALSNPEVLRRLVQDPADQSRLLELHQQYNTRLQQEADSIAGVGFDDSVSPERQLSYNTFLQNSGIADALAATGVKLKFTNTKKSTDWFAKLLSKDSASLTARTTASGERLFFLNAMDDARMSDLHEMGHVVDYLLEFGGWGAERTKQWQELKKQFAGPSAGGLLGAATNKAMLDVTQPGNKNDVNQLRDYYGKSEEFAAQAYKGYMLGKPTKFKTFMERNFPELHEIFTQTVAALRTTFAKGSRANKAEINAAWGNGQAEINKFFESLFLSANKTNIEDTTYSLIKEHNLSAKVSESMIEAVAGAKTLAGPKALFDLVRHWAKGDRVEEDLLDQIEFVNQLNRMAITSTDLAAPRVASLPNVRRLQGIEPKALEAETLLRLPEEDRARVLEYLAAVENLQVRGQRALDAIDQVLSNKSTMYKREDGPMGLYDKGILLLQVDSILGRWMRGDLPEQKGRPLWDKGEMRSAPFKRKHQQREVLSPLDVMDQRKFEMAAEFPLLSKYINQIHTGEKRDGFVGADGSLKAKKRMRFDSEQEAQEFATMYNNESKFLGYVFKAKAVTAAGGKQQWVVSHRKDDRAAMVAEYRDDLNQLNPDLLRGPLADEPEVYQYWTDARREILAESYYSKFGKHVGRVTKHLFNQLRGGNPHALPKKFQRSVLEFLKGEERDSTYGDALRRELGIATQDPEDILIGLYNLAQTDKAAKDDLMVFLPKHITNMVENFSNSLELWMRQDINDIKVKVENGDLPPIENGLKEWLEFSHGLAPNERADFHHGVEITQNSEAGGLSRSLARGTTKNLVNPRTLLGKGVKGLERVFNTVYGGMQTIAASNKLFEPLGKYVQQEEAQQTRDGQEMMEVLRWSGEMVDVDGKKVWVSAGREGKKDDSNYIAVHGSKKLNPLFNQIARLQNEAGSITFERVLKGDFESPKRDELMRQANELISKNFDLNNPKHRKEMELLNERLERGYAYHRKEAEVVRRNEIKLQEHTTANLLFRGADFDGTPEMALEAAAKLQKLSENTPEMRNGRLLFLTSPREEGGLGWEMQRALNFDDKWSAVNESILAHHQMMLDTPGYISEQRLKQWLVSYNEPKGEGAGVGTGLRDFETAEEAWAFMREAKAKGITLNSKQPEDQFSRSNNYRSGTDRLEETINRVVSARMEMAEFMLSRHGDVDPEQIKNLSKMMSGIAEEVATDLNTNRFSGDKRQRQYKAGREYLDMAFQQEEAGWRTATKYARKITDLGFELYMNDQRLAPFEYERKRFKDGLKSLRVADGKGQRLASKVAFSHFILGNISSAVVEAVQWPLSLSHVLVEDGASILDAFRVPAKMMGKAAMASAQRVLSGKNDSVWKGVERELIDYAVASNALGVHAMNDISSDSVKQYIAMAESMAKPGLLSGIANPARLAKAYYKATNGFYSSFARTNAELGLVSAYTVLKNKQYGGKSITPEQQRALFDEAIRTTNKANGSWGRSNRPVWFNSESQSVRTAAQLMWSLQGFASNHVANHLRLIKNSLVGSENGLSKQEVSQSRKALALMTTMQVAGLGVMGHTLTAGLSKLIESTFGVDPEAALLEFLSDEFEMSPEDELALAEIIQYGGLHQLGMPIDLQSRMSVAGLGPVNQFDGFNPSALGGPLLSTITALKDDWMSITKGDQSLMRWSTNLLPNGLQRAVRMELFDNGQIFNKSGKFVMDPTVGEKIAAYAGFSSKRYADTMRRVGKNFEANEADGRLRQQVVNSIRNDLNSGDSLSALNRLKSNADYLGMQESDLAARVADKDVEMTFGRASNVGAGPNAQRAARLYPNELPSASGVERKKKKFQTLEKLGHLPDGWQRQLHNEAMMDHVSKQFPLMPRSQQRNLLRDPGVKSTIITELGGMSQYGAGLGSFASQFGQY